MFLALLLWEILCLFFLFFQKFLNDLNTNLQNVSVKAASNELVSRNNQAEIAKLRQSNNSGSLPNNDDENHLN